MKAAKLRHFAALSGAAFRRWTPNILQILSLFLISAGFWVIAVPAGLIVAGLCVGVIGWAVDK